ncbi:MAG: protease complex subunit PrcB family protein [Lachnospiraceae bacterium]|nr:protease complex subunit PrcB family protein [Lachnospiraceae bacterium]
MENVLKMREKRFFLLVIAILTAGVLTGCTMLSDEKIKLRDLDFTVLSEEMIPEELQAILEEKKAADSSEPFKLTYSDNEHLYICIGYGEQAAGGYSIAVNELYLTDSAIYVNTSLLGPESSEKTNQSPSYPLIVIKTEKLQEPVIFE